MPIPNSNPSIDLAAFLKAQRERAKAQKPAFIWNEAQSRAISLALRRKSIVICGAAGSGKTTVSTEIVRQLWETTAPLNGGTSNLTAGNPGLVVLSFTRRAVANFARILGRPEIPTLTLHKLLEFHPLDDKSRIFVPRYDGSYKLPHIETIILEESSMVSAELFELLYSALPAPDKTQFVILGDIQQLTPPIGKSIFRAVLAGQKFEKVELRQVYRQAGGSPILEAATQMLDSKPLAFGREENANGILTIAPFPKAAIADAHCALQFAVAGMQNRWLKGQYNPDEDIIIVPYRDDRKSSEFTSNHLGKEIARFLDDKLDREVFTIQCGPQRMFFAVGDKVMYNREDAKIVKIRNNPGFAGFIEPPSRLIDRNGIPKATLLKFPDSAAPALSAGDQWSFDEIPTAEGVDGEDGFFSQTSHFVLLEFPDGSQKELTTASEIRQVSLAYATTAYAVQGMQARRVFVFLHHEHSRKACNRETLYTSMTRAMHECVIVCDAKYLTRGVASQLIQGNTLEEKICSIQAQPENCALAQKFGF